MRFVLLTCLMLTAGCHATATTTVGGRVVYEEAWQNARKQVSKRAAFELNCSAEQLTLSILATFSGDDQFVNSIGVEGCGHRAVYLYAPHTAQWVLNSRDAMPINRQ